MALKWYVASARRINRLLSYSSTARSTINDVVEGLNSERMITEKPFGIQELIIRIKALMGKAFLFTENKVANHFEIGSYLFDPVAQTLLHAGTRQELSHRESEILKRLCENRNQWSTRRMSCSNFGETTVFQFPKLACVHYQIAA